MRFEGLLPQGCFKMFQRFSLLRFLFTHFLSFFSVQRVFLRFSRFLQPFSIIFPRLLDPKSHARSVRRGRGVRSNGHFGASDCHWSRTIGGFKSYFLIGFPSCSCLVFRLSSVFVSRVGGFYGFLCVFSCVCWFSMVFCRGLLGLSEVKVFLDVLLSLRCFLCLFLNQGFSRVSGGFLKGFTGAF